MMEGRIDVALSGVPETMLWTLYHRGVEASREDAAFDDPECVRIFESIDYDYEQNFGKPSQTHPHRSMVFDEAIRDFLSQTPNGLVVELGAGLETTAQRLRGETNEWVCVDLPEVIAVRRRFLPETDSVRYIEKSATDPSWITDLGEDAQQVCVTAQGLLMYFEEADLYPHFQLRERYPRIRHHPSVVLPKDAVGI